TDFQLRCYLIVALDKVLRFQWVLSPIHYQGIDHQMSLQIGYESQRAETLL
ncbi:hypothetical protein NPIL_216381, partial [Nephila pilipes]